MTKISKKQSLLVLILALIVLFMGSSLLLFKRIGRTEAEQVAPNYSVSSSASSVRYGAHSIYQTDTEGLVVSLAKNDKFYFNRVIDLNNKTAIDNIVSLFVTPSMVGSSDAHYLVMHFTDAYNPLNTITITCWDPWQDGWGADHIYMFAYKNIDEDVAGRSSLSGVIYKGAMYGTEGLVSFSGQEAGGALIGSREVTVSFDYAEKQVFGTKYNIANPLIADFDDTDYFVQMWDGFTTGECFLSIEAGNYKGSTFNFVITNIAGYDLSEENFTTTRKPEISIDTSNFNGLKSFTVPVGSEVPLPEGSVYSIYDKNLTLNKRVLKNNQDVAITGNSFVADTVGEYKIIYSTTDKFNNYVEEKITIKAIENLDELNLVLFEERAEFVVGEKALLVGDYAFSGTIVGKPVLKVTASLVGNTSIVYEIETQSMEFFPQYVGEYAIRYEYSDYVQSATKIRKVKVVSSDSPYIYELPQLPDYFIKNAKYALSNGYGYVYTNGQPTKVLAEIYAVADDGAEKKIDNVYKVNAQNKVKIIYRVKNGNETAELSKEIKVIDVQYGRELSIVKYFEILQGDVLGTANERYAEFTFASDGLMQFINTVQGENAELEFSAVGDNFKSVDIYLVDSVNANEQLKITYTVYNDSKTYVSVNDSAVKYGIDGSLKTGNKFNLTYVNATKSVCVSSKLSPPIYTYLNGETFNGFSSSLVKIYYGVNGVKESTALRISKINNQPIYDLSDEGDVISPEFVFSAMRGDRVKGDKITISPMIIKDVLDPYVECSISVTAPNGTYVVAKDGVTLQNVEDYSKYYEYELTEFGSYATVIIMKDGSLNKKIFGYQNNVVDMVGPTLTIDGEIASTAKVGEVVKVPSATAIDDIDGELDVSIYVVVPNSEMYDLTNSRAFVASFKGIYKIYYFVTDESGNVNSLQYTIVVE